MSQSSSDSAVFTTNVLTCSLFQTELQTLLLHPCGSIFWFNTALQGPGEQNFVQGGAVHTDLGP